MPETPTLPDGAVVVFGGTGFLGRRVVSHLLSRGFSVRIATRHPERADQPRVQCIRADVNDDAAVAAAVEGCFGVVNAVSLYVERGGATFHSIHVEAAARIADAAAKAGVQRLVHLSGIGADPSSPSPYIASRGQGEGAVQEAFPRASLVRPAVMVGHDDAFLVPLAGLLRRFPVFPLFGRGETRLQPPHVEDVAAAIARLLQSPTPAALYELGGPQIFTYRELVALLRHRLGVRTLLMPLPFSLWRALAGAAERLPHPPITRNQVELMRIDNVVSGDFPGFAQLGILPRRLDQALAELVPR